MAWVSSSPTILHRIENLNMISSIDWVSQLRYFHWNPFMEIQARIVSWKEEFICRLEFILRRKKISFWLGSLNWNLGEEINKKKREKNKRKRGNEKYLQTSTDLVLKGYVKISQYYFQYM